jgi:hypothetical protein
MLADPNPTAAKLTDLLVTVITGVEGGTEDYWRGIIGTVHQAQLSTTFARIGALFPAASHARER